MIEIRLKALAVFIIWTILSIPIGIAIGKRLKYISGFYPVVKEA